MTDQVPAPTPEPTPTPAPAYAQPAYAPARPWNVLSIVSLVTSLLGISLVGIITGHLGLNQIKKTGEQGHGLALAGTIIGYAGLAIGLIVVIVWIVIFAAAASSGVYNY